MSNNIPVVKPVIIADKTGEKQLDPKEANESAFLKGGETLPKPTAGKKEMEAEVPVTNKRKFLGKPRSCEPPSKVLNIPMIEGQRKQRLGYVE